MVKPNHADDFLNQIGRAVDIAAPRGHPDEPIIPDRKAKPLKDIALLLCGDINPAQRQTERGIIGDAARSQRRGPRPDNRTGRAAAMVEHQLGRQRQPVVEKGRINAAFKPLPGVAGQAKFLAGPCDVVGIEIGAFDENIGGRIRNA